MAKMKVAERAKLYDVLAGLAELGPLRVQAHGEHIAVEVFQDPCQFYSPQGTASFFSAGTYAGEMISATGDKVIAVVKRSFPGLAFMSDAERAKRDARPLLAK